MQVKYIIILITDYNSVRISESEREAADWTQRKHTNADTFITKCVNRSLAHERALSYVD